MYDYYVTSARYGAITLPGYHTMFIPWLTHHPYDASHEPVLDNIQLLYWS